MRDARRQGSEDSRRLGRRHGFRWAMLSPLALVALVGVLGCEDEELVEEESRTSMALAPQTRVFVDNPRGNVHVLASPDSTVRIEARKRAWAETERRARALADGIEVLVEREDNEFRVLVTFPERFGRRRPTTRGERASVQLDLYLPEGVPLRVTSVSADLIAENTIGTLEFRTTSGDLQIERHRGPVLVQNSDGDVTISQLEGVLDIKTTSGDLEASTLRDTVHFDATSGDFSAGEVGGPVRISTVSGDVEASNVGGDVQVTTVGGDIAVGTHSGVVALSSTNGDVSARLDGGVELAQIETTSGDVDLVLPGAVAGRLDVTTATGEVVTRLPMKLERATRRQLSGILGAGGRGRVSIRTSSGDITIRQESMP